LAERRIQRFASVVVHCCGFLWLRLKESARDGERRRRGLNGRFYSIFLRTTVES